MSVGVIVVVVLVNSGVSVVIVVVVLVNVVRLTSEVHFVSDSCKDWY